MALGPPLCLLRDLMPEFDSDMETASGTHGSLEPELCGVSELCCPELGMHAGPGCQLAFPGFAFTSGFPDQMCPSRSPLCPWACGQKAVWLPGSDGSGSPGVRGAKVERAEQAQSPAISGRNNVGCFCQRRQMAAKLSIPLCPVRQLESFST